jgi:hypothetical protein
MKMFKGQIELKGSYKLYVEDDWFVVFDEQGNRIYYENSDGDWSKIEYDEKGNQIYWQNNDGEIIDNRPKITIELTQEQLDKIKHLL